MCSESEDEYIKEEEKKMKINESTTAFTLFEKIFHMRNENVENSEKIVHLLIRTYSAGDE